MRKVLLLLSILTGMADAITLEVCQVHKPLSLHGTDVVNEFDGAQIQAGIYVTPAVLSGAMPESLISAVGAPFRFAPSDHFNETESNLLILCGITLTPEANEEETVAVFDLSKLKIPEQVELPVSMVLKMAIQALKETLKGYQDPENDAMEVRIEIRGTSKGTEALKSLSEKFSTKR